MLRLSSDAALLVFTFLDVRDHGALNGVCTSLNAHGQSPKSWAKTQVFAFSARGASDLARLSHLRPLSLGLLLHRDEDEADATQELLIPADLGLDLQFMQRMTSLRRLQLDTGWLSAVRLRALAGLSSLTDLSLHFVMDSHIDVLVRTVVRVLCRCCRNRCAC